MQDILSKLKIKTENKGACIADGQWFANATTIESINPTDEALIAKVQSGSIDDYEKVIAYSHETFLSWRKVPAPKKQRY